MQLVGIYQTAEEGVQGVKRVSATLSLNPYRTHNAVLVERVSTGGRVTSR